MTDPPPTPKFKVLQSVRCLDCGEVYAKPVEGGTVRENPGCPGCGYLGWVPLKPQAAREPRRSDEDRQRHPSYQSR